MLWWTVANDSYSCHFIACQAQGLWRFASSTAHCTCRRLSNPWWGKHNRVFFHALYSTRALIRWPAFACALELPEHWETLESEGRETLESPRWAKENPQIFRLWLCGTQALRMSSCPESSSSAVMISRSMDLPQWGRRYALGISTLLMWSCWDLKCSKASQHWMFCSRGQGAHCTSVSMSCAKRNLPTYLPKHQNTTLQKPARKRCNTLSGDYPVCLVVSGVSQSLRAGRLKMMSTKERREENHRPRIDDEKRLWKAKAYKMH